MASIRARLTGTYTLALAGTMLVFSATIWFTRKLGGERELERYVIEETQTATELIRRAAGPGLPLTEVKDSLVGPRVVNRVALLLDALPNIVLVTDRAGNIVYGSYEARLLDFMNLDKLWRAAMQLSPTQSVRVNIARDTTDRDRLANMQARGLSVTDRVLVVRTLVPADLGPLGSVIVATSTTASDRATREPFGALLALAPVILLVSIASAYYIAGSTLRPLDFVTTELGAITDGRSLHRRLPVDPSGDELARLTATLNAMIGRLETSFGALRRFTADASHELKTPLTVLRANVERAMTVPSGSPDQLVALEEALQEITRMTNLVDSLLTLARFDEGRFDLHRELVELEPIVRDVTETALILGETAGLRIVAEPLEAAEVLGDPTRLRQLFLNLVTNAIKYTPRGGTVEIALRRTGDTAVFSVRDSGIGIAAADLPYIFDRFWRADRARSRRVAGDGSGTGAHERTGFGLGLAISQWIAQAHGGTLTVVSRLTRGSTFTVTLPLRVEEQGEGLAAPRLAEPAVGERRPGAGSAA